MEPFVNLASKVIYLYTLVLIVACIISLLISFNILNRYQPLVARIYDVLLRLTEPLLAPIRRYMPDLGGVDISPIVLILALNFLDTALHSWLL